MKKTCMKLFSLLFCLIALGACEEDPEVLTGNIIGKVTDSSTGEVMQGVTVTITPGGTSRTTGSDGYFEFRDLEPKQYEIQARKNGYTTNNKTVTVITGYDVPGDIQLTPIAQNGKLALDVSTLNFGSQNTSMAFSIQNNGNKTFNWNISGLDKVNWLSVSPTTGTLQAGRSNAVTVTLNRDRITEYKEATIIIHADNESLPLKITAEAESKTSKISLSSSTLNFGTEYSSLTFDIKNIGNAGNVDWDITGINEEWIKVNPISGSTGMGKSSAVIVNVDRSKMEEGRHSTTILVNADGESLKVTINAEKSDSRYLEVTPSALVVGTNETATLSIMSHNGSTVYELYGDGDFSWASFDKTEGVIPEFKATNANTIETLTMYVDRTGLAAGTYSFTLIIRSDLGDYNVPVTMTVEENQAGGGGSAEIISCSEDLEFILTSCKLSGTTATIDMTVKNISNSTINLKLGGGGYGYAFDDQGHKYDYDDMRLSIAGSNYGTYWNETEIPADILTKVSIKIYNVSDLSSIFNYIKIASNQESDLILKNIAIESRSSVSLETPQTTGTLLTCNENLEFTLLDCKYGTSYTTLSFRVKNNGKENITLKLGGGGYGYAYDNVGNKYDYDNMRLSIAGSSYGTYWNETILPAGIFTNCAIRFYNVDTNATEFGNITVKTNQESDLVFKNVKIRK